jgi:hypothetical protein
MADPPEKNLVHMYASLPVEAPQTKSSSTFKAVKPRIFTDLIFTTTHCFVNFAGKVALPI